MRLLIFKEIWPQDHVLYLEQFVDNMLKRSERTGRPHFLWGRNRPGFNESVSLDFLLKWRGPFDGILVVGFKRKSWLEPLAKCPLPKAIILDDYYPTKHYIRDANRRLDKDNYDLIFAQTQSEKNYLIEQERRELIAYLPMSVDVDYFTRPQPERDLDVVGLWGRNPKYYPTREAIKKILDGLGRNGFKTFTNHVFFDRYIDTLNRAKIFVNGRTVYGNIQSRFCEVAAAGALMITEQNDDLAIQGFTDRENIVLFQNMRKLEKLIRFYLAHEGERIRIAEAGRELVRKEHNNNVRIEQLERTMESLLREKS